MASTLQRFTNRYHITSIGLEITCDRPLAERIRREVELPAPPAEELTERQLLAYLQTLTQQAHQARQLLEAWERQERKGQYRKTAARRVQILVARGNRVWGQVVGTGQVFAWLGSPVPQSG